MDYNSLFKAANLPLPKLAKLAGLHVDTVRSISIGRTHPRPVTLAKLAAALRTHSATLAVLADQLDPA